MDLKPPRDVDADLLIQGGGFAGMTLALLAAQAGRRVVVVDIAGIPERTDGARDIRTVAISAGSSDILTRAGVWPDVVHLACPIRSIDIMDGDDPTVFLRFNESDAGGESFGHIIDNIDLRRGLIEAMARQPRITHIMHDTIENWSVADGCVQATTRSGKTLTARLLVGADGRSSAIREQAGIAQFGWAYRETAMVVTITHEHPHDHVAVERFRTDGPFAVLPVTDTHDGLHRSAIVWTLPSDDPRLGAPPSAADIQKLLPAFYGRITDMGRAMTYPLALANCYTMVADRVALIADAGHVMHPIAGQGLNVGLRDVAALADRIATYDDAGDPDLLRAYDRGRLADVTGMLVFTDKINSLFGVSWAPMRWARRFGMGVVARHPKLRGFFAKRAMGRA